MAALTSVSAVMRRGLVNGRSRTAAPRALLVARRGLGETVCGPPITDFAANYRLAMDFFTKRAVSYFEFKQQCVSLRLFVFGAVTFGCTAALIISPPKSSYWATWGPFYMYRYVKGLFYSTNAQPLFLTQKLSTCENVPGMVESLLERHQELEGRGATGIQLDVIAPAPAKAASSSKAPPKQESTTAVPAPVSAEVDVAVSLLRRVEELERRLEEQKRA